MPMNSQVRKVITIFLLCLVLILTLVALLGIWDIISLQDIFRKIVYSLLVLTASAAVIAFIYSLTGRE